MRRLRSVFVATALVLAACGGGGDGDSAGTEDAPPDEINLKVDFTLNPAHTFIIVGQEEGFFSDENLTVELTHGTGSLDTLTELSEGRWDLATGDMGDIAKLVSSDAEIKTFFAVYQTVPYGYAVKADSGITSPRDFEGKTLGTQEFNSSKLLLPAVCEEHGIDCDKVDFVNVDFNVQVQSFLNGDFDILGGFENAQGTILRNLGEDIRWFSVGDIYSQVFATTDTMVAERSDLIERFVTATQNAMAFTVEHPEEALDVLLNKFPQLGGTDQARDLAMAQVEIWGRLVTSSDTEEHGYGYLEADTVRNTIDFWREAGAEELSDIEAEDIVAAP